MVTKKKTNQDLEDIERMWTVGGKVSMALTVDTKEVRRIHGGHCFVTAV
jgi:hypothetical protein